MLAAAHMGEGMELELPDKFEGSVLKRQLVLSVVDRNRLWASNMAGSQWSVPSLARAFLLNIAHHVPEIPWWY
jgi:hypothetical protein